MRVECATKLGNVNNMYSDISADPAEEDFDKQTNDAGNQISLEYSAWTLKFHDKRRQQDYVNSKTKTFNGDMFFYITAFVITIYYLVSAIDFLLSKQTFLSIMTLARICRTLIILPLLACLHSIVSSKTKIDIKVGTIPLRYVINTTVCYHQLSTILILWGRLDYGSCRGNIVLNDNCNPVDACGSLPIDTTFNLLTAVIFIHFFTRACDFTASMVAVLISFWGVVFLELISPSLDKTIKYYALEMFIIVSILIYYSELREIKLYLTNIDLQIVTKNIARFEYENKLMRLHKLQMNKLIGGISHDLLTPVQSLSLDLRGLHDAMNSAFSGSADGIKLVKNNMDHLQDDMQLLGTSVNRGIDFCKAETDSPLTANMECVDFVQIAKEAIKLTKRSATSNMNIELSIIGGEHLEATQLLTDKNWLFDNFYCLLSNAVKYAASGNVIFLVEISYERNTVQFSVENVSASDLNEIEMNVLFEGPKLNSRKTGGSGLGLYVLSRRVLTQQGQFGFKTIPDTPPKSQFWFSLPLFPKLNSFESCVVQSLGSDDSVRKRKIFKSDAFNPSEIVSKSSLSLPRRIDGADCTQAPTVLVVDDSVTIQKSTRRSLMSAGFSVEIACDGAVSIPMMENKRYAAVLMDIEMPVMGGIEATRKIRASEMERGLGGNDQQIIIGITASISAGISEQAISAGMNDFVYKPFSLDYVLKVFQEAGVS